MLKYLFYVCFSIIYISTCICTGIRQKSCDITEEQKISYEPIHLLFLDPNSIEQFYDFNLIFMFKVEHVTDQLEQNRNRFHEAQDENRLMLSKLESLER